MWKQAILQSYPDAQVADPATQQSSTPQKRGWADSRRWVANDLLDYRGRSLASSGDEWYR